MQDDGASFVDLESICILLIASFLIEINAKKLEKSGDENCQSPNLGGIIDDCSFYMNSHYIMSALNSIYTFVRI